MEELNSRSRRSTSSVPRGRSPGHEEFRGTFSDNRKKPSLPESSLSKGHNSEKRMDLKDLNVVDIAVDSSSDDGKKGLELSSMLSKNKDMFQNSAKSSDMKITMGDPVKGDGEDYNLDSSSSEKFQFHSSKKKRVSNLFPKIGAPLGEVSSLRRSKLEDRVSGSSREKRSGKYLGKLHEKLADPEGKAEHMATDINKTKEMLDMNNTDALKMMLSVIQEKISGIEKAMVNVIKDEEDEIARGVKFENDEKSNKSVMDSQIHIQGLNAENLEDTFPHHKLIWDRASSVITDGNLVSSRDNATAVECQDPSFEIEADSISDSSEAREMDEIVSSTAKCSTLNVLGNRSDNVDSLLISDKTFNGYDEEKVTLMTMDEEVSKSQMNDIGIKSSTAGWFVSEGDSVLLAHDDGTCSFYDTANCEEKAEYNPPSGIYPNLWRDCWIIRAPGADGCTGKYVVAASAGNSGESGFCSWDFYDKSIRAFHFESDSGPVETDPAPLSNNSTICKGNFVPALSTDNRRWWYQPCGPLIVSSSSIQKEVKVYDIRDGDQVMKWESRKPVAAMNYSSPLQWRNRSKVVIAETDRVSTWDVSSLNSQAVCSASSLRNISAMHIKNSDAELGGGVRQRTTSQETGNDGVFCTGDTINVLDFRQPYGICMKIAKIGVSMQAAFSRGDSLFIGCTNLRSFATKNQSCSHIDQLSLRQQKLVRTFTLPELNNVHDHYASLTQVWGNSRFVMGVCGAAFYVFDALNYGFGLSSSNAKEVVASEKMYDSPSFDYSLSRVLIISRDRPASWRYLL